MKREELKELHYITPICNVHSIMTLGLLSHRRAEAVGHCSIAMEEIQTRRDKKTVPGGLALHEYVNLYINARNKMLFKIKDKHADLCVLGIDPGLLDLPGVIVADRNASSDYVRFEPAPNGLQYIDERLVYAHYWTHPDNPIEEFRHGSIMCTEVLVPDRVNPCYIMSAYVSCSEARSAIVKTGVNIAAAINSWLFFR
jgi:hypothetical protein